ncbi:MAG: glycosyltransferase family 4 protein [Microthrixaceae bacterium]
MSRPTIERHAAGADASAVDGLRVAYLVNQYPKVSHSFVRREVTALERLGVRVDRFAQRGWEGADLVDPADRDERERTTYLVNQGGGRLAGATARAARRDPRAFAEASALAVTMARRSDRASTLHGVYLAEAALLVEALRGRGVTHLHAHFGTNSAEIAMLARCLGGPPYSFTVHGPEEFDAPEALHLREKVRHSRFVVAISSFGRSQLFRWIDHDDWPKVEVVHCGLERGFSEESTERPSPDVPRLVSVGRLSAQKGTLLLLDAARRVLDSGRDLELVLAGDGEMRGEVEAHIRALDLTAKVRITGWISGAQVREEILAARAMVLPSFAEGLPVVIMEAMALGRPVISTFVAGIPELVTHGEHGWLCPAGDVDRLADAMVGCLDTPPHELDRLGSSARARVWARHDVDVEARRLAWLFAGR